MYLPKFNDFRFCNLANMKDCISVSSKVKKLEECTKMTNYEEMSVRPVVRLKSAIPRHSES